MRARILALTLLLAGFAAASGASAAAYDFTVSLVPGTTTWELRVSSLNYSSFQVPALEQVMLGVSDSLETFTSAVEAPYHDLCVECGPDYLQPVAPGFNLLTVPLYTPQRPPSFPSLLLGTFSSDVNTASLVQVLPGEDFGAQTIAVIWAYEDPAQLLDFSITVVPEPAVGALLILAATASLARRARA